MRPAIIAGVDFRARRRRLGWSHSHAAAQVYPRRYACCCRSALWHATEDPEGMMMRIEHYLMCLRRVASDK